MPTIRPPRPDELERLRDIERAAGAAFAAVGMPEIAEDEPPSVRELARARAWVAADGDDRPLAYVLVTTVDGVTHVEQVSVDPGARGRGLGAALIDHVDDGVLTLTTFRDVPWNAPYYARLGFEVVPPEALGPELAALVAREARVIPGGAPRVTMRRVSGS